MGRKEELARIKGLVDARIFGKVLALAKDDDLEFLTDPDGIKSFLDAQAASSPLDEFKKQLAKSPYPINKPDPWVIEQIVVHFSSQLLLVKSDCELSKSLYDRVKELPHDSTQNAVSKLLHITVDGPLHGNTSLLTAVDTESGELLLIKLLNSPEQRKEEKLWEAEVVTRLQFDGKLLVRAEVVEVQVPHVDGKQTTWQGLKMTRYACSVNDLPQLPSTLIARGIEKMKQALAYLHANNVVHVDFKSDNVMVDNSGEWFLGDFGSSKEIGKCVGSFTRVLLPVDPQVAFPELDWFLLGVLAAFLFHDRSTWKVRLCSNAQRVDADCVCAQLELYVEATGDTDLLAKVMDALPMIKLGCLPKK